MEGWSGAEPAPERERVLYMMLSRILPTMVATVLWGGGNEDDCTSKQWKEKLGDRAGTDEMESMFSFVKHHLISRRKKQENSIHKNDLF